MGVVATLPAMVLKQPSHMPLMCFNNIYPAHEKKNGEDTVHGKVYFLFSDTIFFMERVTILERLLAVVH
jgi:hypothetical protein